MDDIYTHLWETRVILMTYVGWRFGKKKIFEFSAFKTHKNLCTQNYELLSK